MTLVRLTNPVTAAHWLAECEAVLATAIDDADLDRIVDAAALARLG
jgi:hypothetical protein